MSQSVQRLTINFVSINNHGLIPVTNYIIDYFGEHYDISITECRIENRDAFSKNKNSHYISQFKDRNEFLHQSYRKKVVKYFYLGYYILKILLENGNQILYTSDVQVINLFLLFNSYLKNNRIKLLYHQFELIEEKYISNFELRSWRNVVKNAFRIDLFVCPEVNRIEYFKRRTNLDNEKILLFPNTLPVSLDNNCLTCPGLDRIRTIPNDAFVIGHIGSVGPDHYLNEFIQIVNSVRDKNIYFLMIGKLDEGVRISLSNISNANFILFEEIPHRDLSYVYNRLDIGFILYKGVNLNFEYCAPNKLYEYWSYGVFVIGHPLKGLLNIVNDSSMGALIDLEEIDMVVRIIEAKSYDSSLNRDEIISLFSKNYSIERELQRLDDKIKEIIND